jgi:hypothetical protein
VGSGHVGPLAGLPIPPGSKIERGWKLSEKDAGDPSEPPASRFSSDYFFRVLVAFSAPIFGDTFLTGVRDVLGVAILHDLLRPADLVTALGVDRN